MKNLAPKLVNALNNEIPDGDWLDLQTGEIIYITDGEMEHPYAEGERSRWTKVQVRSGTIYSIVRLIGENEVYAKEDGTPPENIPETELGRRIRLLEEGAWLSKEQERRREEIGMEPPSDLRPGEPYVPENAGDHLDLLSLRERIYFWKNRAEEMEEELKKAKKEKEDL
ncbi:MAG: hypothetical protein RL141_558 [Candidatus Parcubacteria bacterium]|jgi:hypothetical protein